jgi:hypothetical protein
MEKVIHVTKSMEETLSLWVARPLLEMRQTMNLLEWQQCKNGESMCNVTAAEVCFIAAHQTLLFQMQIGRGMVTLSWVMKSLIPLVS